MARCMVATGGDWQWEFDWGPKGANPIDDIFNKVDRWLFPSAIGEPFTYAAQAVPQRHLRQMRRTCRRRFRVYQSRLHCLKTRCQALEVYFGGPSPLSDYGDSCAFYNTAINGKMAEAAATLASWSLPEVGPRRIEDRRWHCAGDREHHLAGRRPAEQAMADFAAAMTDLSAKTASKNSNL